WPHHGNYGEKSLVAESLGLNIKNWSNCRRLAHYENLDRGFQKKYGVSFEEFEEKNVVKKKGFSWEVESDAMAWEQAVDGIKTMRTRLEDLDVLK
ncbi:hypothetical protein, partial [Candidatus Hakubella thermalkaliphila]